MKTEVTPQVVLPMWASMDVPAVAGAPLTVTLPTKREGGAGGESANADDTASIVIAPARTTPAKVRLRVLFINRAPSLSWSGGLARYHGPGDVARAALCDEVRPALGEGREVVRARHVRRVREERLERLRCAVVTED